MIEPTHIPYVPLVTIEMTALGETVVDGVLVSVPPGVEPREEALRLVALKALALGRPVRATAIEADGEIWPLIVDENANAIPGAQAQDPARTEAAAQERAATEPAEPEPAPVVTASENAGPTSTTAPPPARSAGPAPARHDLLVEIRGAVESGRLDAARELVSGLVRDDESPSAGSREVGAYVAALTGRPEVAARLYAELALDTAASSDPGAAPERYAANAYRTWRRVVRLKASLDVGPLVLRAQERVHGADDPWTQAATRWLDELRSLM